MMVKSIGEINEQTIDSIRPPDRVIENLIRLRAAFSEYIDPETELFRSDLTREVSLCPACMSSKSEFFAKRDGVQFLRCQACGSLYQSPVVCKEFLHDLYSTHSFSDYGEHSRELTGEARKKIKYAPILKRYPDLFTNTRVLDIGCSRGDFLEVLRDQPGVEAQGVEINEKSAQFCREEKGLDVYAGDLRDVDLPENHYDVICAWGVLVHFADPEEFFQLCHRFLVEGGTLIFGTANPDGFEFVLGRNQLDIQPTEICIYTEAGFKSLAERTGYGNVVVNHIGTLDVSLVQRACRESSREEMGLDPFLWRLMTDTGDEADRRRAEFQAFLLNQRLTGYVDYLATKGSTLPLGCTRV